MRPMRRLGRWIRANAEPVLALAIAVTFGLLGVLDVIGPDTGVVNAAVLLVLALLAATLLRDRSHVERAMHNFAAVQTASGPELSESFAARRKTDRWVFKGGAGTSMRTVDLPRCVDIARQESRTLRVQIEVLDPTDDQLCTEYARFRALAEEGWERRTRPQGGLRHGPCRLRRATALPQRADGRGRLHPGHVDPRWDLSEGCVIVTPEDGSGSSLVFDSARSHYRALDRELVASFNQARRVPVDRADEINLGDPPTTEDVRRLFTAVGLPLPSTFSERDVMEIVGMAVPSRAIR